MAARHATTCRTQFRTAPDLVACLRRFNALRTASLSDVCEVQVQLGLGENKAVMDAHHGNGFARDFLADDGMAEVLRLLHHPDKHVHREAFRFARALSQQGWVTRQLVGRYFVARLVPLINAERNGRPADACRLAAQLLATAQQGGYARDAAVQLLDCGGLENLALALSTEPSTRRSDILGRAAEAVHCVAACGPAYRHRLAAANTMAALCAFASADLMQAVCSQRKPLVAADLPQLRHAAEAVSFLAAAAVGDGGSASANLLDSGAVEFLVQLQTPWLDGAAASGGWRDRSREALRGLAAQHPAAVAAALEHVDVPFPPDTSPSAWQAWWTDLRADLRTGS
jgi:hypothetical protein